MSFALTVVTDTTSLQLNDGAPFRLERLDGASGADVVRLEQRGPLQHGATDLGARIQPRVVELSLLFTAADDATLDGYRDTLMAAFRPLSSTPVALTVTRDDGETRVLSCYAVDDIAIDLVPEHRPGHLHRATVKLRAATPYWQAQSATVGTITFGTVFASWQYAGGSISAGEVVAISNDPSPPSSVALITSIPGSANWMVAAVLPTTIGTVFFGNEHAWGDNGSAHLYKQASTTLYTFNNISGLSWPGTIGANFHAWLNDGTSIQWWYWDGSAVQLHTSAGTPHALGSLVAFEYDFGGDVLTWWQPPGVDKIGIFQGNAIDSMQLLAEYMLGVADQTMNVVNEGDVNVAPQIILTGTLIDPVITNTTTGVTIDLTGLTVDAGESVTIDLDAGDKTLTNAAGSSVLGSVTTPPVGASNFYLAPGPVASGGTNIIVVGFGSADSNASIIFQYTNQYMSF